MVAYVVSYWKLSDIQSFSKYLPPEPLKHYSCLLTQIYKVQVTSGTLCTNDLC